MRKISKSVLTASFGALLISLIMLTSMPQVIAQTEERFEHNNQYSGGEYIPPNGVFTFGQTFTPQITHELTKIVLIGRRDIVGGGTGDFIVSIRTTENELPVGDDLISKSVPVSIFLSSEDEWEEVEIIFNTQITLESATQYAMLFKVTEGEDNFLEVGVAAYGNPYLQGMLVQTSGEVWFKQVQQDIWFEEWGYQVARAPTMRDTLIPFLPILGLALGIAFTVLFLTVIAYVSNRHLTLPYEMIFVPLFCVIAVGVSLIIIVIFGL